MHRALRALVSHTRFLRPCAPLFLVPSPLRALVPHVPCAFRVLVPQVPRVLRTLVSQVPRDLHALGPHFFYLYHAEHTLMDLMPRSFRVSCLLCFSCFRCFRFFQPGLWLITIIHNFYERKVLQ